MKKRPDLVLLIAIWEFFSAFIAFMGIWAIAIFAFPAIASSLWESTMPGAIFGLSIGVFLLLCFIGLSVAAGVGLLRAAEWGRILGIIHSALSLFSFPIGTTIGILALVYLTKTDIVEYFKSGGNVTPA